MHALLTAKIRHTSSRSALRALRVQGDVPAIVYGRNRESKAITISGTSVRKVSFGSSGLYELVIEGEGKRQVLVNEVQRHPVTSAIVHLDLHQVALNEAIDVELAIHLTGAEAVERRGGLIQHEARTVVVHCLPTEVPEHVTIDIESMNIGDVLRAGDLVLPKGVHLKTDEAEVVVTVMARTVTDKVESEPSTEPSAQDGN